MVGLIERLPKRLRDEIGLFDAMLMFYHGILAFDHVQHRLWVVRNVSTDGPKSLRVKYDAAVKAIGRARKTPGEPAAGEKPQKPGKSKSRPLKIASNVKRSEYLA